ISNEGSETISSVDLGVTVNNMQIQESYDNLSILPGGSELIDIDASVILERGANTVNLQILKVNGMDADENLCNNIQNIVLEGFTPADKKKILVEEGTGTWCQWCPRGDVFMNLLTERYPDHFVGVAVHNRDPMEVPAWDDGLTGWPGFTGFPSVVMNRESVMDPSAMEPAFVTRVQGSPIAYLTHGAEYDAFTRELIIDITTHFNYDLQGDELKLFVGLTEDNVTGTTSGYNQANAYAGGGSGVMGGYELLPTPVPASQMVYNHVGRYMFTPYAGMEGAYAGQEIKTGSSITHRFTYTIPDQFNHENMHIVSAFVTPPPGVVDNAQSTTIEEAVSEGLTSTIDVEIDNSIEVYPNPLTSVGHIEMDFEEPTDVRMEVTDLTGKRIASRNYGKVSGKQIFPFDGTRLESGIYFLKLFSGDRFTTKRIVIAH
ncbi:MAG: Omp28-related outer membrane protein, partial [Saprospiraceae bacterium]|nr:Omp28-related outer membrane protein [Saprospiraceae bacterium]